MVKKLFKHEAVYYTQSLGLALILLLSLACLNRLIQLFENDHWTYDLLFGSSVFILVAGSIVCIVLALIISIVRFYKNLFTAEGYLTFTLPISETQHILAKLITAIIASMVTELCVVLGVCIATSGDFLIEIFKAMAYVFKSILPYTGIHIYFYILEVFVLLILASAASLLIYYSCIAIGQLSKKNRVLAAVGVYFAYSIANQFIGSFISIAASLFLGAVIDAEKIALFFEEHVIGCIHGIFLFSIVLEAFFVFLLFMLVRFIISKKLNLE